MKKVTKTKLIKKLDTLFSKVVRQIDKCEWCGSRSQLQTAHIYSRRYRHTRWDTLNAICLCAGCHFKAHQNPVDFTHWVEKYLGEGTMNELRLKAHIIKSMTLGEMEEIYNNLKLLEEE